MLCRIYKDIGKISSQEETRKQRSETYPLIKENTPLGVGIACFKMLIELLDMSFRRDLIWRNFYLS